MRARSLAFAAALGALAAFAATPASSAPRGAEPARGSTPQPAADATIDPFLAEAGPLLSEEELAIYRSLERPYQRDAFAKRFWAVRDPYPQTGANELRDRWRDRLAAARERFATLEDDRARALLFAGEPQAKLRMSCPEVLASGEVWIYPAAERVAEPFALVFLPAGRDDRHRFWSPREGIGWLANRTVGSDQALLDSIAETCPRGRDLAEALVLARDWKELDARWHLIPNPGSEWARGFLPLAAAAPPGTPALDAELAISFPGRRQSRTRVEGTFRLTPPPGAAPPALAYALDGEVIRGDELFETFRYRFDPPASALDAAGRLTLVFERALRPGVYTLVLRLADLGGGGQVRQELPVEVPAILDTAVSEPVAAAPAVPAAPPEAESTAAPTEAEEATLRLLAPLDRLVTGRARVEADVRGDAVASVAFLLDDKKMLEKRRPPFTVELDFGPSPRPRRVTAIAYGSGGGELARDEALINGGPHRFAVRLLNTTASAPGPGGRPDRILVEAAVEVPENESLDRLELFVDDRRVATLFQPPWSQSIAVPPEATAAWVRAVAHLAGGGAAEDVRLLGGAGPGESVDVDLVELYTSVLDRKGRPVEDLAAGEVRVAEDGEPQEIRRFERVIDRPMHAAVMLDVSGSMVEELLDLERAALGFFERVLTPRDRAAVITFADQVRLAARFTAQQEVLAGALAGLEARGDTHLYDALAFALHYFSGIRGQRALVLISDGFDSGSRYPYADVLEYARRTGVAIYAIGLGAPTNPPEGRLVLDQLGRETGGRTFYIQRANEVERIYRTIEREIRAQWLIAYQSTQTGGDAFRTVEVEVDRPGLEARTIRGYYP